jgi:hypothetical protein
MDQKDRSSIMTAIYGVPKAANYTQISFPNYRYLLKLLRESVGAK